MKNFCVLCVTVLLLYLGYDAMQPPPAPPPAPVAARPAPTAVAQKVYFHSALDAPAMATNMTTGTSYFSTDPNSRFVPGYVYDTTGSRVFGGPTYIVVPGGGPAASTTTATSPLVAATAQAQQNQRIYYRREESPRATPTPSYVAH